MTTNASLGAAALAALLIALPLAEASAQAPIPLLPRADGPAAPPPGLSTAPTPITPLSPDLPHQSLPEVTGPRSGGVQVQDLGAPDYNATGVIDEAHGGFVTDMWAGSNIATVEKALPLLPAPTPWRSIARLERKLLLTTAAVPVGKPSGEPLIKLRAEKLWDLGDVDGVNALLKGVPNQGLTPALRRLQVDAALLQGDTAGACDQAAVLRSQPSPDNFAAKLQVFCQFATGKANEAGLGVDVLREQKIDDPAFFLAADTLSGVGSGKLESFASPSPLVLAMARSAKMALPEASVTGNTSAAVLRSIAMMPSAILEARLIAAEKAEALGAVDTEVLRQLYESVTFTPQELAGPVNAAATDKGVRSRALLFRAALQQTLPTAKAEVIAKALTLATDQGSYFTAARLYAPQIAELKPSPELAWFAYNAARALYAAQRPDAAKAWVAYLRGPGAAAEGGAAAAAMWPLSRLATPEDDRPLSPALLAAWHKARGEQPAEAAQRRAAVLYSLLAALGQNVPTQEWLPLYDGPALVTSQVPRPALWQGLRVATEDLRLGETVMLAMDSLGTAGLTQADPSELYRVVAALRLVGLDADARALAVEAAIANGI